MPDFAALMHFSVHPLELILRGSLTYVFLFLLFRFVLRRDAGSIGIADMLLVVLIADASQNAMAAGYSTLADGAVLVLTLAAWNWLMDWASFHSETVRRFVEPPPVVLVRRGRIVTRSLRGQHMTVQELLANLREHGVDRLADVKIARLEHDGAVSVIRMPKPDDDGDDDAPDKRMPIG